MFRFQVWLIVGVMMSLIIGSWAFVQNKTNPAEEFFPSPTIANSSPSPVPTEKDLSNYPDREIDFDLSQPISVQTLVEHRSALHQKRVFVQAVVVDTDNGWCPGPGMGLRCTNPGITINDSNSFSRNKDFDIHIELPSNSKIVYQLGQQINLNVQVFSRKQDVTLEPLQ